MSCRDALVGSACTVLSAIGLYLLRRARRYIEKRCREACQMVEGVKEASDAKDEISPPIGDPEETALKTAGDRAEDSAE